MRAPEFIFATCKPGAEKLLKAEVSLEWPDFRFAYSRPGFLTFKAMGIDPDFDLRSTFARAYGLSLGKVTGESFEQKIAQTLDFASTLKTKLDLHVWARDDTSDGENDRADESNHRNAERSLLARRISEELKKHSAEIFGVIERAPTARSSLSIERAPTARSSLSIERAPTASSSLSIERAVGALSCINDNSLVFDVIVIDQNEWWLGYHEQNPSHRPWAGGVAPFTLPPLAPSRAYLKMVEGVELAGLPLAPGEIAVEFGSSPGGASFALLERGLKVRGVDPGEMSPNVLSHKNFTHLRRQSKQLTEEDFKGVNWIFSDMNVSPREAIDALEWALKHVDQKKFRGGIFTLKLASWDKPKESVALIRKMKDRVLSFGMKHVQAAHLTHNRNEVSLSFKRL